MLATVMAMRLREIDDASSDFPWHLKTFRRSLNGFCCAHEHPSPPIGDGGVREVRKIDDQLIACTWRFLRMF
jgi:hypothetical protein